jgi:hypothetical protein
MALVLAIFTAALVPVPGHAQEADSGKAAAKKKGPIVIEKPIVIRATPRSPQASYILQRAKMYYEIKILEEDPTAKVLQSVEDSAF